MKNVQSNLLRAGLLSFTMLVPVASHALTITTETDSDVLTDTLFLNIPGLEVTNSELFGFPGQAGVYTNVIGTYGLPQNGIVFSSGDVLDYQAGGNTVSNNSTSYGGFNGGEEGEEGPFGDDVPLNDDGFPDVALLAETVIPNSNNATPNQEALLDPITGGGFNHNDVVQLNIEFEAASNVSQVTFFGAFGSEEFPEFTSSSFIDGFGLYMNGTNYAGVSEFNGTTPLPVNIAHPSFAAVTGTELDGVLAPGSNPVLRFDVPVEAGETNNFTLILADTSDAIYDTTVYLSSFIAANPGGGGGVPVAATGESEFDPLLPVLNENGEPVFDENGGFIVDISDEIATNGQTVWIDPPVTVGYTYETSNGVLVETITAPSFATIADLDGFTLTIDGVDYGLGGIGIGASDFVFDIFAITGLAGVESFTLTGIDTSLSLDPANPLAFPIGVTTNATAGFSFTITPITEDVGGPTPNPVPLPATGLLYMGAVLVGGGLLRRRRKAA